jgi:hypothetical protein
MDWRSYAFEGKRPDIAESAHVSREATVVGDCDSSCGRERLADGSAQE